MSEAELFDQYLDALRRDPKAAPPPDLDAETAAFIRELVAAEQQPAPMKSLQDRVWHKTLTLAQDERDSFARPASRNGRVDEKLTLLKRDERIQTSDDDRTTMLSEVRVTPGTRPPTSRYFWQYTLTIAAAVLILALLGGLLIQMVNNNPNIGIPGSQGGTETPILTPIPACDVNADYMVQGEASIDAGDYEAAAFAYQCAIEVDPTNYVAYLWRGGLAAIKGDYDQLGNDLYTFFSHLTGWDDPMRLAVVRAMPVLTRAINDHPDDVQPYLLRGLASMVADLPSLPDFERVMELAPDNAAGYLFHWSISLSTERDPNDPNLDKGMELASDSTLVDWILWTNLTQATAETYLPNFTQAIELNPKHLFAYEARGMANAFWGDTDAASDDFYQHIQNNQTDVADEDELTLGKTFTFQATAGTVYRLPFRAQTWQKLNITATRADRSINYVFPVTPVVLTPACDLLPAPYRVQSQYSNTSILIAGLAVPKDGLYTLLVAPNYSGMVSITVSEAK
jgi:tetratricopeptide (TPR) repeat protein